MGEGVQGQNRDNQGMRFKTDPTSRLRSPNHWTIRGFNLSDLNQVAHGQKGTADSHSPALENLPGGPGKTHQMTRSNIRAKSSELHK